jgi:hypothetical protein
MIRCFYHKAETVYLWFFIVVLGSTQPSALRVLGGGLLLWGKQLRWGPDHSPLLLPRVRCNCTSTHPHSFRAGVKTTLAFRVSIWISRVLGNIRFVLKMRYFAGGSYCKIGCTLIGIHLYRCWNVSALFCISSHNAVRSDRVIKKSLCTWWLQYRKLQVMFKVSPRQSPDIYWHTKLCSRTPCSV